jgi:hypothetical protein
VALLLMGVTTAGASAYYAAPSRDCRTPAPAPSAIGPQTLAPSGTAPPTTTPGASGDWSAQPATSTQPCSSWRRSSYTWRTNTGTSRWSHPWVSSSTSRSSAPRTSFSSGGRSGSSSSGVSRGGFGGSGHAHSGGS